MNDRFIQIQNLTDYHLSDFLTCPQTFWKKHILKKENEQSYRQDLVEHTMKETLVTFFSLPVMFRTEDALLRSFGHLINKFPGDHELEKLMHHLSHALLKERDVACPLMTYEKLTISVPEWDLQLTMTVPLALGTGESFVIKKFVMDDNSYFIRSWTYFCIFFCQHAFQQIPAKLEVIHLLSGTSTITVPTHLDILKSKDYMELVKESMKDPSMYFSHLSRLAQ